MPLASRILLHFFEAAALQDVIQVGVPDTDALKAEPGDGFYTVPEVEGAEFLVGVWFAASGQGPGGG